MFVQFIRGRLADESAILDALERWEVELRPTAGGFLGSTAGVAQDGQFVLMARFTDEDAARRNSNREEQGAWWRTAEHAFTDPVVFFDSSDVDVSMGGGADDAGFVQVLIGRGDRQRARDLLEKGEGILRRERPDIIGGITAWHGGGKFVDVAYFRSEAEAREGEAKELSAEGRAWFEQLAAVMPVQEYLDLRQPRYS